MARSDSDEEFEALQRIETIARKHFEADTWVLSGNSTSDEEWIQSAPRSHISALKSEFNNLKREWKRKQPPGWHIVKLVNKDGPAARKEIERLITEFGVDLNTVYELYDWGEFKGKPYQPLLFCVNSMPMLNLLVKHGIDINKRGLEGADHRLSSNHFLHHTKSAVITKYLLSNGVDPNIRDGLGRTPLQLSFADFGQYEKGNNSRVGHLIRAGADINAQDKRGRGVIHEIYRMFWTSGNGPRVIEAGAQVNLQDGEGCTCLHQFEAVLENDIKTYHAPRYRPAGLVAVRRDQYKKMEKVFNNLFKYGSNPFIKNKKGHACIDNELISEMYSKYIANLLKAEQKLALATMLIDSKEDELPADLIQLIGEQLPFVHDIFSQHPRESGKIFQRMLREVLVPIIRESYPAFDTDDMVARYKELIMDPKVTPQQRKTYENQLEKRLKRLKIMNSSKSLKSQDSRKSRSVRSGSIPNKSQRKSRSLNSNEELQEALRMSVAEAGQKKRKKTQKKKKTQKTHKKKKIKTKRSHK
jgi:hypothetical protein